jgi:trimethylamine--corrinoid protein Co-methyltransferase
MTLKTDTCYYGTGSDCPYHIDFESGQRRTTLKKDIEALTQFCDALPNIDFIMSFGIATDAPPGGNFVHQYEAMLLNPNRYCHRQEGRRLTMVNIAASRLEHKQDRPPDLIF